MKLPLSIAEKLQLLTNGDNLPASALKNSITDKMLEDGVLIKKLSGRNKAVLFIKDALLLQAYLHNHFGIEDLAAYINVLNNDTISRTKLVQVSSDSKTVRTRSFSGFLVNSYEPINSVLNGDPFVIHPAKGSYTFMADYQHFSIPANTVVVGIENAENFHYIQQQQYLFADMQTLFVCRYPYSADLIKWLQQIPNRYLHFGDLDFEGIRIFLSEYQLPLGSKASFFIPRHTETLLQQYGNRNLYNTQRHIPAETLTDIGLQSLVQLFHQYKKVLEQEVFIQQNRPPHGSL